MPPGLFHSLDFAKEEIFLELSLGTCSFIFIIINKIAYVSIHLLVHTQEGVSVIRHLQYFPLWLHLLSESVNQGILRAVSLLIQLSRIVINIAFHIFGYEYLLN